MRQFVKYSSQILLITVIFLFAGCQKCIDCQYDYKDPETNEKKTYDYDEFCGTSSDVKDFKEKAEQDAKEVNGNLTCTKETQWF